MSLLDNEENLVDNNDYLCEFYKKHISRFINNQMNNCPGGLIAKSIISFNWVEIEEISSNEYLSKFMFYDEILSNSNIVCKKPVEKQAICSLSDIYRSIDDELFIVPKNPSLPMLLYGCTMIPDYIKFATPSQELKIFPFQCSEEVNCMISKMQENFFYRKQFINNVDRIILTKIYLEFGEYNSLNPKIIEFEKKLKDKLLLNIKK